jgi:RNA polymerase sigma factor (sigma-70 family)
VAGLGFKGGGRLGGNPLEDVVLAVSVLHQEHVAVERFKERFRSDAVHYGRRHPLVQEDEEDWWCQLLVRLMGLDDQPGKLRRYSGRSGLKNWLARVAMNFPGCFVVPKGGANDGLEEIARSAPIPGPDDIECQELLGDAVRDAIGQLTPQQRALLYMLFAEGLAGKDVARILGIHPGQVSRRKEMAIEQLHAILGKLADASSRGGAYRDCLESLTGTRNWRELADVFLRTLRDLRPIDGDTPNEEADA